MNRFGFPLQREFDFKSVGPGSTPPVRSPNTLFRTVTCKVSAIYRICQMALGYVMGTKIAVFGAELLKWVYPQIDGASRTIPHDWRYSFRATPRTSCTRPPCRSTEDGWLAEVFVTSPRDLFRISISCVSRPIAISANDSIPPLKWLSTPRRMSALGQKLTFRD